MLIRPHSSWYRPSCTPGGETVVAGGNLAPEISPDLLAVIGHWEPKIGDPSFMGWFTVGSYYLCAALGFVWVLKSRPQGDATSQRIRIFTTLVVLFLGLSKHFNLPAAVTEAGRIVAARVGGYEYRREFQGFMLLLVAVGLVLLIRWSARRRILAGAGQRFAPELVCLGYLCGLFILRAISFHGIGSVLHAEVWGVRINWIAELLGIYALFVILLIRICTETGRR